ncbi:MAG: group II truncated hemoglobin [Gammaproteobacteria bacterium]|nr:group II truncated hemoglobin [Gammaproteobacteria bacterium]MCB1922822.1 group II truncated hemoglobin [Gammaproteobacteria bacterium]
MTESTPYERIGGEARIRELVDRFYDYMDSEPAAAGIRDMHAKSLRGSREKLFLFLSGWLGGPDLYIERYGHPRLRQRHLPFAIDSHARDQWMGCMSMALDDMAIDEGLRRQLMQAFAATADHMRNRADYSEHRDLPVKQ